MIAKVMAEGFLVFDTGIDLVGIDSETSWIDLREIDVWFTINNPVGEFIATSTTHHDPTGKTFRKP